MQELTKVYITRIFFVVLGVFLVVMLAHQNVLFVIVKDYRECLLGINGFGRIVL